VSASGPDLRASPPLSLEEVTADWVGAALQPRYPGVVVSHVDKGSPIHGTGTNLAVLLSYERQPVRGPRPPTRMWLKSCYEPHFASMASSRIFEMEPTFYRDLAPRLPICTPACHYAGADPATGQGAVLLQDLAADGAEFGDATRPITPDRVALGLDLLAQLHAHSWGQAWPKALWYVTQGIALEGERGAWFNAQTPEVFARYIAERTEANTPASVNDPERITRAFRALAAMSLDGPLCLIHSDSHLDNFYFKSDGSPGLMDWQSPRYGSWAWDVSYFIISALDIEVRRAVERDLLDHYLGALRRVGVDAPDREAAWLAYRRYNAYGLFVKIVNPDIFKPRTINLAWMSRHVAATEDLETFKSLGV
jgi:hypothetical protein